MGRQTMTRVPCCSGCGRSFPVCVTAPCADREMRAIQRRRRGAERAKRDDRLRGRTTTRRNSPQAVARRLETERRKAQQLVGSSSVNVNAERYRAYWQRRAVELGIGTDNRCTGRAEIALYTAPNESA